MKALNANTIALLLTFSIFSPFAQSADFLPAQEWAPLPDPGSQSAHPAWYKNTALRAGENHPGQVSSFGAMAKDLLKITSIRTNAASVTFPHTGIFTRNDRAAFSAYAPMQAVNGALSFAEFVSQSPLDDSTVALIQILSLAVKQQINTELKYSLKLDNHRSFDSAITYRLNLGADTDRPDLVVSMRYNIKF